MSLKTLIKGDGMTVRFRIMVTEDEIAVKAISFFPDFTKINFKILKGDFSLLETQ